MVEVEISRRTFLKNLGISIAVGVGAGAAAEGARPFIEKEVTDLTHYPTGDAAVLDLDKPLSKGNKIFGVSATPILEEVAFRAFPSGVLTAIEKDANPLPEVLMGTRDFKTTRREFIVGAISSLVFGATHNITNKKSINGFSYKDLGFDAKRIPISQTLDGMMYWYLQRKLGIFSNIFAHGVSNSLYFSRH